MAEEKILLNIEFNNAQIQAAIKNISTARKSMDELIATNKKLAEQGEKNSEEYIKNSEAIKALNSEINQNSKLVQASTQANKANADSLSQLKARNQEILILRDKLTTETKEGRDEIAKLNAEYDANSKVIAKNSTEVEKQRFNIGNYRSALEGISPQLGSISQGASSMVGGLKSATQGIGGMTSAAQAFGKVGILLLITGLVAAFQALMSFLTGSEAGMDALAKASAQVNAVLSVLKNTIIGVGSALFEIAKGNFSAGIDKLSDSFSNLDDRIVEAVRSAGELADIMDTLDELRLQAQIRNGEEANQIKNLIIQSKSRLLTEKQRSDLLAKASELEKKITGEKLALQIASINAATRQFLVDSDRLDLAQKEGETTIDFTKRVIAQQDLLFGKRKELADQLGEYNSLLDNQANVQEKIQNQQDTIAEKAAEAAAKRQEEEKKRLEEIEKKKAEIAERELTAANELAILQLEKQAREIQGLENQTDKLLEIEQTRAEQLLANAELTASEREKIIFESDQRINEILAQSREREELERQAGLTQSLEDFKLYTEGLINEKKNEYLQGIISKQEYDQEISDLELATLETQALIKQQFGEQDIALQTRITDYKIALGQKEVDIKRQQEQQKVAAVQQGLGTIASAFNKQSVAFKVLASVQTLITTYQSAIAAFNSLANIPYIGTILGIAAAAAATANGLAAVAKINSTNVPKMEEGGAMDIQGPRHSAGGVDVHVGGKRVANVEGGEKMVILKRGADSRLLKNLSLANMLVGGRDFYQDRVPRYRNADGGFVARSAANQVGGSTSRNINQQLQNQKIVLQVSELHRVEDNMLRAQVTSELS